ncbi:DUF2637 domain-containing protein [Kitasatospora sp. NPDC086791]|uniref:DUF2637 domain-containing protein n=1 Tax=Kitasatospora sp. NPDC086791 TaxID=3155178 RepID=UPI00342D9785
MTRPTLNKGHKTLIGIVVLGAAVISAIGFAGSYNSVRALAADEGFGRFAQVLPIGVDAGIVVLYALDLLLTWLRMPYPLLRQTAWFLTAATIVMNSASAWGRPLAMGMHAVVPILFVIIVEAARHAVGRWANLTAGKREMEGFDLRRWLLKPFGTFSDWRLKMIWGIYSSEEAIELAKWKRILRGQLKRKHGRKWRKLASQEALLLLYLAQYGEGSREQYIHVLSSIGIPVDTLVGLRPGELPRTQLSAIESGRDLVKAPVPNGRVEVQGAARETGQSDTGEPAIDLLKPAVPAQQGVEVRVPAAEGEPHPAEPTQVLVFETEAPEVLFEQPVTASDDLAPVVPEESAHDEEDLDSEDLEDSEADPGQDGGDQAGGRRKREDVLYDYYCAYVHENGNHPTKEDYVEWIHKRYGEKGQDGGPLSPNSVKRYWAGWGKTYRAEYETPKHPDLLELAGT